MPLFLFFTHTLYYRADQNQKKELIKEQKNETTLSIEDKNKLFNVFLNYLETGKKELFNVFNNKELQITNYQLSKRGGVKYLRAIISFQGQHSTPSILAINKNNKWKIIFIGQDYASCDLLQQYNFPKDMRGLEKCFKQENNRTELIDR